jgi:hypothetical protein
LFQSSRERLAWFAITVLLGVQFRFDFLRILDPAYKESFQIDSDLILVQTLVTPGRAFFDPMILVDGRDYTSQFGLHGMVMAAISPGLSLYGAMRLLTAMLLAAVIATAVIAVWRTWGGRVAGIFLALVACSWWLNAFGPSTYWQLWTLLLPTLAPLLIWPRLGSGRRKWILGGALVAGLITLKALCGYEFITTVIMGSVAAVAFHEFRGRIDLRLLLRLGLVAGAGVIGFVVAIGLHATQLFARYGDASVIASRAGDRTFSPFDMEGVVEWVRLYAAGDDWFRWMVEGDGAAGVWGYRMTQYLRDSALSVPSRPEIGVGPTYAVPIWVFVLVFAVIAWRAYRGKGADVDLQRRLSLAGGLALLGALSWLVLGFGHMVRHPHIDAIVYYLPFLPLVFLMVAMRVASFSHRLWPARPAAPTSAPAVASELVPAVDVPQRDRQPVGAGHR